MSANNQMINRHTMSPATFERTVFLNFLYVDLLSLRKLPWTMNRTLK